MGQWSQRHPQITTCNKKKTIRPATGMARLQQYHTNNRRIPTRSKNEIALRPTTAEVRLARIKQPQALQQQMGNWPERHSQIITARPTTIALKHEQPHKTRQWETTTLRRAR